MGMMMRIFAAVLIAFFITACAGQTSGTASADDVTLYPAQQILTQNPSQPTASAVAVDAGGTIVGVDEAKASEARVAFTAPIARAVMGLRAGEEAPLQTPKGPKALRVESVAKGAE